MGSCSIDDILKGIDQSIAHCHTAAEGLSSAVESVSQSLTATDNGLIGIGKDVSFGITAVDPLGTIADGRINGGTVLPDLLFFSDNLSVRGCSIDNVLKGIDQSVAHCNTTADGLSSTGKEIIESSAVVGNGLIGSGKGVAHCITAVDPLGTIVDGRIDGGTTLPDLLLTAGHRGRYGLALLNILNGVGEGVAHCGTASENLRPPCKCISDRRTSLNTLLAPGKCIPGSNASLKDLPTAAYIVA